MLSVSYPRTFGGLPEYPGVAVATPPLSGYFPSLTRIPGRCYSNAPLYPDTFGGDAIAMPPLTRILPPPLPGYFASLTRVPGRCYSNAPPYPGVAIATPPLTRIPPLPLPGYLGVAIATPGYPGKRGYAGKGGEYAGSNGGGKCPGKGRSYSTPGYGRGGGGEYRPKVSR